MRNSGGGQGTLMTSILRPLASVALVKRSYASVERSYCTAHAQHSFINTTAEDSRQCFKGCNKGKGMLLASYIECDLTYQLPSLQRKRGMCGTGEPAGAPTGDSTC